MGKDYMVGRRGDHTMNEEYDDYDNYHKIL